ncbi:PTS sugar transporter subunit IIA [Vibrio sp. SS-MA-C1-2]|uniref:PTS sugar transporter subunit IIA n=1 Tax=Vibrio sp. SS-MA-C1-2 TaxID=2908646 RepID=UPI001F478643|nr:PTS sugar transporter subunit IIA [Vibrio sp. SS-MA-C1-2]UJF17364.1 PTS sugar transporter subunit IIA [Vibrio sp. SS-MA-C1-2]
MSIFKTITFILPVVGMPSWKIHHLQKLASSFHSIFLFVNVTKNSHDSLFATLGLMANGNSAGDLCQLHIEGKDAELAQMVLQAFIEKNTIIIKPKSPWFRQEPLHKNKSFLLPFELNYHYLELTEKEVTQAQIFKQIALMATKNELEQHSEANKHQLDISTITNDLLFALTAREEVSSTYIGGGIALPHLISRHITLPQLIIIRVNNEDVWFKQSSLFIGLLLPKDMPRESLKHVTFLTRSLLNPHYQRLVQQAESAVILEALLRHKMAYFNV